MISECGSLIPAGGFRQAAENDRFATANPSCGGLVPQRRDAPQSHAALDGGWPRVALKSETSAFKKLVFIRVDSWLVEAPMKIRIADPTVRSIAVAAALLCLVAITPAVATTPQYQIYDIGVIDTGDTASQGFGVSHAGVAVGRSIGTAGSQAFTWTVKGGIIGLPNLAGRSFAVSNSANDSGIVVGTAATTLFGSDRLPVIWQNGAVSQLPLPAGETLGDANSVNASTVAVGSVDAGSLQRGAIYSGGTGTIITQTTTNGSYFLTAFGINDSGPRRGPGHRSNECRTQRWDRL